MNHRFTVARYSARVRSAKLRPVGRCDPRLRDSDSDQEKQARFHDFELTMDEQRGKQQEKVSLTGTGQPMQFNRCPSDVRWQADLAV